MLDAVMLVLRETLEAALFISLLMALGSHLALSKRWTLFAIPLGLCASWILSRMAGPIAEAFDGSGQELVNGALYLAAILCFIALNALLVPVILRGRDDARDTRPARIDGIAFKTLLVTIVSCSMAREGSEVWIYLSSFAGKPSAWSAAVTGGLIGTGIGLSLCALVYYAFSFMRPKRFLPLFLGLTTLVVGGLSMQLAKQGLQVGWLDSGKSLWDSSWLVSERSWFGEFLHALFGYDANPDLTQAIFYFGALTAMAACLAWQLWAFKRRTGVLAFLALSAMLPTPLIAATHGIYHPYVNTHEREIEYGITWRGIGDDAVSLQRASLAYAWTDNFSTELYLLSEFATHDQPRARAYEFEARWQLTEQGEYSSDWGLLLEVEAGAGQDRHEISAGVLWEKELGQRWVAAANGMLEYEFGSDVRDEFETAFRGQLRYLLSPAFEPAVEIYLDDTDYAIGPVALGAYRLAAGRQLRWEVGLYFGINEATPSLSLRSGVEFEF